MLVHHIAELMHRINLFHSNHIIWFVKVHYNTLNMYSLLRISCRQPRREQWLWWQWWMKRRCLQELPLKLTVSIVLEDQVVMSHRSWTDSLVILFELISAPHLRFSLKSNLKGTIVERRKLLVLEIWTLYSMWILKYTVFSYMCSALIKKIV